MSRVVTPTATALVVPCRDASASSLPRIVVTRRYMMTRYLVIFLLLLEGGPSNNCRCSFRTEAHVGVRSAVSPRREITEPLMTRRGLSYAVSCRSYWCGLAGLIMNC